MRQEQWTSIDGPCTAEQIREEDRHELSGGQRIYCAPAGDRHSHHNLGGGLLLDTDPDVQWAGVDTGFTPKPDTLRAPDLCVAAPPKETGKWVPGAPLLAVEYADRGQNEPDLQIKIKELLAAGTRYVWVVRLAGPQWVEVYTRDSPMRRLAATDTLEAPGVLRNPVPVRALFDRSAAHRLTLKNLLQREGYEDLEAVLREGARKGRAKGLVEGEAKGKATGRAEGLKEGETKGKAKGKAEGLAEGEAKGKATGRLEARIEALLDILMARGIDVDATTRTRIRRCRDQEQIGIWLAKAAVANRAEEVF
uniref:Endonuclease, Uma2 family (Restriction endonuclease fold) n=1 Tax=Candidatus Kentrum sp. DK TaxID=2126562 RepID=A0A450SWK2_9GAMM|nr:MAG: Endonuclease, Uma2 family (restriction endonuclease fold) [Candidatus Kentron sp. DK]